MAPWSESDRRASAWQESHGEPIDDVKALAFHLLARSALQHALVRLEAAGIPALVVKGAVLAHTLYASPIDRPIRDVDLRVLPRDVARAGEVLGAATGARVLVRSRVYRSVVVSFEKIEIDVEGAIGPPFVCAIGVEEMLERGERTTEGLGFSHVRPELHDHALVLAVNLFKDRFVDATGSHARDLELLARLPGFDPEALAARAEEARCRTLVHVVARYVGDRSGDDRWRAVATQVHPTRAAYAERVLESLRRAEREPALAWRLRVRGSSDSRLHALGALGASALREVELVALR